MCVYHVYNESLIYIYIYTYITLHYIALHYITLHYIALHYITLHTHKYTCVSFDIHM
jgi:hypothetical protein